MLRYAYIACLVLQDKIDPQTPSVRLSGLRVAVRTALSFRIQSKRTNHCKTFGVLMGAKPSETKMVLLLLL